MKVEAGSLQWTFSPDGVEISFLTNDRREAYKALERVREKPADVKISVHRDKRSNDANAYMWELVDQMADAVGEPEPVKIYREAIRHAGRFFDVAVMDRATETLVNVWSDHGIGFFTEEFDSKLTGCRRVRLYIGSHWYNTKEMSRLLDYIVDEADRLGIETRTPDEIRRMESEWKSHEEQQGKR